MTKETVKENIKIIINEKQAQNISKILNKPVLDIIVKPLPNRKTEIIFITKRAVLNKKTKVIANEMHAKKPKEWGFDGLKGILDLTDNSFYIYYPNKEYKESNNSKYFY